MIRNVVLFALLTAPFFTLSSAEAAPRWRRSRQNYSMPRVTTTTSSSMPVHSGDTGSAQGVAQMMATRGVVQHFGNPTGTYEGVASGFSPEHALNSCCFANSGMPVVDQGVACGRDGRWYACKRYRR